jgi:hypothetical protein
LPKLRSEKFEMSLEQSMLQRHFEPDTIFKSGAKKGKNPFLPASYRREHEHHASVYRYADRRSSPKNSRLEDRPKCNPIKTSQSIERVIRMTV